jgi:AraC family transcriptional regulator, transcriptional activator of pobA
MRHARTKPRFDDSAGRNGPIVAERCARQARVPNSDVVTHDFAALSFYVDGAARIELQGEWALAEGDVLIVPAGSPHRLIEGWPHDVWRLALCVPCLAVDTPALLEAFERVRDGASPVVRIPVHRRAFFAQLFEELRTELSSTVVATAVRQSLLTLILNEVTRAAQWSEVVGSEGSIVTDTLRFIERHCLEPLTLTHIAATMHRTPSYITTALSRATGRSARAWLIAGRMAEARRRLLHSDESVDIIAERVGYADATHFIRLFRRAHGLTPAAWRARQHRSISSR